MGVEHSFLCFRLAYIFRKAKLAAFKLLSLLLFLVSIFFYKEAFQITRCPIICFSCNNPVGGNAVIPKSQFFQVKKWRLSFSTRKEVVSKLSTGNGATIKENVRNKKQKLPFVYSNIPKKDFHESSTFFCLLFLGKINEITKNEQTLNEKMAELWEFFHLALAILVLQTNAAAKNVFLLTFENLKTKLLVKA